MIIGSELCGQIWVGGPRLTKCSGLLLNPSEPRSAFLSREEMILLLLVVRTLNEGARVDLFGVVPDAQYALCQWWWWLLSRETLVQMQRLRTREGGSVSKATQLRSFRTRAWEV